MMRFAVYSLIALTAVVVGVGPGCRDRDSDDGGVAGESIHHVPAEFATIQEAIDAAVDGEVVEVAPGLYRERLDLSGKGITVRSRQGPAATVVDGAGLGRTVTIPANENRACVLAGFTITGGYLYGSGGAGIRIDDARVEIRNCCIVENHAMDSGGVAGGINVAGASAVTMVNTTVGHNVGEWDGGGMRTSGDVVLVNCTIAGNSTSTRDSGGLLVTGGTCTVVNSILSGNRGRLGDRDIQVESGELNVRYSCVSTGWTGEGNITTDPRFVDFSNGDLHLRADSPCLGRASREVAEIPATDFEGDPRVRDGVLDMGADAFAPHLWSQEDIRSEQAATFRVAGTPGHHAWLAISQACPVLLEPPLEIPGVGRFALAPPQTLLDLGPIPASGIAEIRLTGPLIVPEDVDTGLQAALTDTQGALSVFTNVVVRTRHASRTLLVPETYPTIQAAVNAARNGDLIQVGPGTYRENVVVSGTVLGLTSTAGAEVTVIDGGLAGSVVSLFDVPGTELLLEGFTLTRGYLKWGGAGLRIRNASPVIRNNIIRENEGYGIQWEGDSIRIEGNRVEDHANDTGIVLEGRHAELTGNTVRKNRFGGVSFDGDTVVFRNNIIASNTVSGSVKFPAYGGGVWCNGFALLVNNVFASNSVWGGIGGGHGGGACVQDAVLVNNTFVGNQAEPFPQAVAVYAYGSLTVYNSILWDILRPASPEFQSKAEVHYSDVQGGHPGTGNIDADPLLTPDYHLSAGSPCLDRGSPLAPYLPATDFEGDPRVIGPAPDMGADERR